MLCWAHDYRMKDVQPVYISLVVEYNIIYELFLKVFISRSILCPTVRFTDFNNHFICTERPQELYFIEAFYIIFISYLSR